MSSRVAQLVLFIIPLLDVDKNPQVMFTRYHADARTGEFSTDLIKTPSRHSAFGAVDIESGHWRVVRCLFGQVAYLDRFSATIISGGASSCVVWIGGNGYFGGSVLNLPATLKISKEDKVSHIYETNHRHIGLTRKNSPSVELYGLHGLPLIYFCNRLSQTITQKRSQSKYTRSLVNQKSKTSSIRPSASSDLPML